MLKGSSFLERQTRIKNEFFQVSVRLKLRRSVRLSTILKGLLQERSDKKVQITNYIYILKAFKPELDREFP